MGFQLDNIQTAKKKQPNNADKTAFLQKEITLFGNGFSNKIKEDFYTEFSVLLKAGITLWRIVLCNTHSHTQINISWKKRRPACIVNSEPLQRRLGKKRNFKGKKAARIH